MVGGSITVDQTVLDLQGQAARVAAGHAVRRPDRRHLRRRRVEEVRGRLQGHLQGRLPEPLAVRRRLLHQHQGGARRAGRGQGRPVGRPGEATASALSKLKLQTPDRRGHARREPPGDRPNFVTEVAEAADGSLYNKVVKVDPGVNQTLGMAEAEFDDRPRLAATTRLCDEHGTDPCPMRAAAHRVGRRSRARVRASAAASARSWRSTMCRSPSPPASGARSSAPTAPARPRCSTPSPATSRRPPGASASSARTSPPAARTSASAAACGAPTSLRCCSAAVSVRDNLFLAARGVARGRFSLLRARAGRPLARGRPGDLLDAAHLDAVADQPVADALARPAAPARDRHGAGRRAALHPVRRAGGRPVAGRSARAGRRCWRAAARTWASS